VSLLFLTLVALITHENDGLLLILFLQRVPFGRRGGEGGGGRRRRRGGEGR